MVVKRKSRLHADYDALCVTTADDPDIDKDTLCGLYERKQREDYDRSNNFLHVMAAFTSRVDEFKNEEHSPLGNVNIPCWMAKAIASGFRLYETNLRDGVRQDLTLDWCFNLTVDRKNDYDLMTITAEKVLDGAYELQWLFGISRDRAIEITHAILERKFEGKANFRCTADSVIDLAKRKSKNVLPTFVEWQQRTGHTYPATEDSRKEYEELLMAYDNADGEGGVLLTTALESARSKKKRCK